MNPGILNIFTFLNCRNYLAYLTAAIGLSTIISCSSEPSTKSNRYGNATSTRDGSTTPRDLDAQQVQKCPDDICQVPIDNRPITGPVAEEPASWCTSAAATRTAGQDLAEHLATICKDGSPTQLMLNTLVPNAYKGSGEPQLFAIKPIENTNKTVSAFFAVAVKMPVTAAEHFQRIAPADGDVATEKGKIQSQGGTPGADVKVVPVSSKDDKDWVRGWTVDSNSSLKTAGFPSVTVKLRYNYQIDHFKFDDAGYLYTSQLKSSLETVKGYQTLNAVFDIDGTGYQLVIAKITADDKGQAAKVRDAVKSLASNLVKYLYQQSTK
ncbi:MAG: hypothetical protein FJ146_09240 [Deltaproteobacteria bacterium]|nr:hypothetical protein [Deltaproteobacteria bacterium]